MDRFDLENKIMNASLVINDLEALAEDMDENPKVSAEVADYYALALLGLAKLCEARFSAVDRVFEYLVPELDMARREKEKAENLKLNFSQDDDEKLWKNFGKPNE
jgi:tRNA U38,U39,U40 pseudouridine synthase TruA